LATFSKRFNAQVNARVCNKKKKCREQHHGDQWWRDGNLEAQKGKAMHFRSFSSVLFSTVKRRHTKYGVDI